MSTLTGPPMRTPYSPARRATCAVRALATSVLVGMQPSLTQVPPRCSRSISAVFMPALARRTARNGPAWPLPITIASYEVVMVSPLVRGHPSCPHHRPDGAASLDYMRCSSILAAPGKRSTEISTALVVPVFFHQCEVPFFSGATSPARCVIGTAQLLAYSTTSPETM